ncbi:WD REPEATS REGION domain-containing protein [Citrus sinensis]|nr:WD REPEATS REGION domain-containing protein [Citrus sinensis]
MLSMQQAYLDSGSRTPLTRLFQAARSASTRSSWSQSEREDNVSLELFEEILQSMEVGISFRDYNGRISSMNLHKSSSYLVTASDDESIRPYDVSAATTFWITKPLVVLFDTFIYSESLRFLSLHDNKYLRYYKGHQLTMTGLLHVQGRPATTYDDQGPVFAVAFGGYIRMFDAHSDAVKFSNDGRLMLPTSMEGHIRVLDSFQGTLLLSGFDDGQRGGGGVGVVMRQKPTWCLAWLHLEVFGMAASRSFDKNGQLATSLKIEFDAHGFDEEFGEHGFDFLGH